MSPSYSYVLMGLTLRMYIPVGMLSDYALKFLSLKKHIYLFSVCMYACMCCVLDS